MVLIANAVVHEGAMMIKFFYALAAIVAMEGFSRLYYSTVEAEIFKVHTFLISNTQNILLVLVIRFLQLSKNHV